MKGTHRILIALGMVVALLSLPGLVEHTAKAFTEETESGRELDEGLPPPSKTSRFRMWQPPGTGYDYEKTRRFWRNYKPPRHREPPRERPKEYLDTE
ncbi:MAG: hypothetical protein N3C12_15520 [Candidatus Binatia bacterium]|nr:hypothetical protein [Candidatus Binatia bacterium]